MNIATFIDAAAADDPARAALVIDEQTISYGELAAAVEQCAARFAARDLAGARIAIAEPASASSIAALLGAARIGAAAALMNPALTHTERSALVENAGCATMLTAADLTGDDGRYPPPPLATDVDDREALVLFTSGTTGLPKAIGITHGRLSARISGVTVPFDADRAPTVAMMSVPYFHVGGAIGLLGNLYAGNTYVVLTRFDAGEWLRLVQKYRVTSTFLVPTMLQRILDHPDFPDTDVSSLAAIAYGAAAAPTTLVRRAMAAMPHVGFANVFGQTETLGAYTTLLPEDHHDPSRVGSVGRPLEGVEVRVVDPETGIDVPPGQSGELWVRSTQNVGEGWLQTGDLGRQDPDGYIYPSGRLKDTINRGGEKFGPIEVEEALRSHPAVVDVAVAGIPDEEMGQRVGAAVVLREAVTLDELRSHCRDSIAYFKLPERLAVVDQIPYNATGKVNRHQLAALITGS